MKIKSIATICKRNKAVILYDKHEGGDYVTQYIGDGGACFPIAGLPYLDEESILTIFDVPEKQRENWYFKSAPLPEGIDFSDTAAGERHIEAGNLSIVYAGRTLKPLQTRGGLVFIESRYLAPLSDVMDVLELYERQMRGGTPYIVAKAGLLLQAVIMPYDIISQGFVERIEGLAGQCRRALNEKNERERAEAAGVPEQFKFGVNPETGEILDESEAGGK